MLVGTHNCLKRSYRVLIRQVRKRCLGEILIILITKFLKRCPVKIWIVLMTAEILSSHHVLLKPQLSWKEFLLKSGKSWLPNSLTLLATIKSWVNRKKVVFSSHSFGLYGQSSEYSECIYLALSFTQQTAQIFQSHFFFSFEHGVMIVRV